MTLTDEAIVMIEIARLHDYPLQDMVYGETGADVGNDFVDNISRFGVITPLIVTPFAKNPDDPQYLIISGHRRRWAAGAAGQEFVPCIVRNYESEDVRDLHFLSFNKNTREKSLAQRVNEFMLYKQKLSQFAKLKQSHEVNEAEDIKNDELFSWLKTMSIDPEAPLDSVKIIEDLTGFSQHFQNYTNIVFGDDYIGRVQSRLQNLKMTGKEWSIFYDQWLAVREKVLNREYSLKKAGEELKKFTMIHEQKLLNRLGGKKEKPVKPAKPRVAEQRSLFQEEDESFKEFMQYREYCNAGGYRFSFVFNKNAPEIPVGLAFESDSKLFRVNLAGLAEYINKELGN
jgi:hypothetical protein